LFTHILLKDQQYDFVLAKKQWSFSVAKVTADMAKSNGSGRREYV